MEVKQEVRLILSDKEKQEFEELDKMLQHFITKCSCANCYNLEGCSICPYDEFLEQVHAIRQTIYKWRG